MFRTVPLSIIMSLLPYTQQWYMSYRFVDSLRAGSGRNCSSVLILLASCMTYTIAVSTVKTSWWWTEELSETCRVLFRKQIWEISASSWFYYKNLSIFRLIYHALESVTPKITVWLEVALYSVVEEYRRFVGFTWPFLLVLFNKNF